MNTYLKYQPPGIQFLSFIGLAAGLFLVYIFFTDLFFNDIGKVLLDKNAVIGSQMIARFKLAQFAGAILIFVIPALLFGYFSSPSPFHYIGLQNRISPLLIALSIVLIFAIQPFAGWLGNLNGKLNFGAMQQSLKDSEAVYNRSIQSFLQMRGPVDLAINLFIMALLPAIGEELFFRGALQKVLLRWSKVPWLAILISSLIFGLMHGTAFKLLPIFALGLMLGTVYYATQNLWYCVIIHFLNNALAVLSVYKPIKSETLKKLGDENLQLPLYLVLISLAVTLVILFFMKKNTDKLMPLYNEENDLLA